MDDEPKKVFDPLARLKRWQPASSEVAEQMAQLREENSSLKISLATLSREAHAHKQAVAATEQRANQSTKLMAGLKETYIRQKEEWERTERELKSQIAELRRQLDQGPITTIKANSAALRQAQEEIAGLKEDMKKLQAELAKEQEEVVQAKELICWLDNEVRDKRAAENELKKVRQSLEQARQEIERLVLLQPKPDSEELAPSTEEDHGDSRNTAAVEGDLGAFPCESDVIAIVMSSGCPPGLITMAVEGAEFYFGCRCLTVAQENLYMVAVNSAINYIATVKPCVRLGSSIRGHLVLYEVEKAISAIAALPDTSEPYSIKAPRIMTLELPQPRYFVVPQIVAISGMSYSAIRRAIAKENLKATRIEIPGRRAKNNTSRLESRVSRQDLLAFLQDRGLGSSLKPRQRPRK